MLVPTLTEIEWVIKPLLEEWAEVASYDAPGVGAEPAVADFGVKAIARRGLEEVDRCEWDGFVIVADEFALPQASHIAAAAGSRVQAMALGHARLTNSLDGDRPAINAQVLDGIRTLMRNDPRTFVRQMFRMTVGEQLSGGYREEMVDEYMDRVPNELGIPFYDTLAEDAEGMADRLIGVGTPMLICRHAGCLMFTDDGFEDAAAALPHARANSYHDKPSTSPTFAADLREFCEALAVRTSV